MTNTSRNYNKPAVSASWAASRETHIAVATAIHAIADDSRSAEAIWEAPTSAEWDNVQMAVEEHILNGDFAADEDGDYAWGGETIHVEGKTL